MVVQVENVGDNTKLQQEVGVGGVAPRDVEVREVVGEEEQPKEDDNHIAGQMAQGIQVSRQLKDGGVKTRSKLE